MPRRIALALALSACSEPAGSDASTTTIADGGSSGAAITTTGTDASSGAAITSDGTTAASTGAVDGTGGAPGPRLYGVTIDGIDPLPEIVDALAQLHHRPTTRVVFDEFVPAADYVDAVAEIAAVSDVMGEILDSYYVAQYSTDEYRARAEEYVAALGDHVDIWEIGNEINGEWLCAEDADACTAEQTADVVAKLEAAFDAVETAGGTTALTLYLNQDCWSSPDNEMFAWAEANVSPTVRAGLDYVLVSYYEDDCNGLQPDWPAVFAQLAAMFPDARLGIGECGTLDAAAKAEMIQRYYGMEIDAPAFVGGWFWWYFRQDMVPRDMPLWAVLDAALAP